MLEKDLNAVLEEIIKEVEAASPGIVVVDSFRTVVRKSGGGTGDRVARFRGARRLLGRSSRTRRAAAGRERGLLHVGSGAPPGCPP